VWLHLQFRGISFKDHLNSSQAISVRHTWLELRHIFLPLTAILLARGCMHASMATFLPTFIQMETGNLWLAGMALTLVEAMGVAGVLTAGSLSDRFGRRQVLLVSLVGAPISLLLFVLSDGWLRLAMLLLTGFTLLSTTPVMLALVQEHARSSPSAANGLFMMVSFMARSAIVVVVGGVGDWLGLRTAYILSALTGLLGIPFVLLLPKK
jgi:FSR family fosmidomycin resistance protein-like MFS transporter